MVQVQPKENEVQQFFKVVDGRVSVIGDDHSEETVVGEIVAEDGDLGFQANESASSDEIDSMSMVLDVAFERGLNFTFEVSI
jgi:hypothetical protein